MTEDAYVFKKSESYVYISLSLSKTSSIVTTYDSTRTILPVSINLTNSAYNFYIWGKSKTGSISPRKVDFSSSSSTKGTILLDFPATTYTFVLAAIDGTPSDIADSSKILEEAVLIGYTNADLAYTNKLNFYLSQNTISGYGNVSIAMLLDSTWSSEEISDLGNYYFTAGLYDIKTGEEAFSSSYEFFTGLNNTSATVFSRSAVPSGNYNFTVKIYKNSSSSIYNYSDRIVVYPNQKIDSKIYIPNIVERIPDAPSDFKAAWSIDSKLYENTLGNEEDYASYGLLLSWKDNSCSEAYFQVSLIDVTKTATAVADIPDLGTFTDSDWFSITANYTNYIKVYNDTYTTSNDYFAGSPEKNNTSLILYIPFDGCYIAKIEAVNDAGISAACYATITDDLTIDIEDSNYSHNTAVYSGKAFRTNENPNCNVINLHRIVYYLNGGVYSYFADAGGNNKVTISDSIIQYCLYGMAKTILSPIALEEVATEDNPALIYKDYDTNLYGNRWNRWMSGSYYGTNLIDTNIGGKTVSVDENYTYQKPNDYTGYKSLYLFARYDLD